MDIAIRLCTHCHLYAATPSLAHAFACWLFVHAGDRMSTDLPELAVIRGILIHKYASVYGKEFAAEASSELTCRWEWQRSVSERGDW